MAPSIWRTDLPDPLNVLTRRTWGERPDNAAVRVVVADGRLAMFEARGSKVTRTLDAEVASTVRQGRMYRVTTTDGDSYEFSRQGCGCGSPLKNFDPRRHAFESAIGG